MCLKIQLVFEIKPKTDKTLKLLNLPTVSFSVGFC